MKKISLSHFKHKLNTYEAIEIDKNKFEFLLCGEISEPNGSSVSELTEGIVQQEDAHFYLINDCQIINACCNCLPVVMHKIDTFMPYQVYPYILIAIGLDSNGYVDEFFCMSSFENDIEQTLFA